MQEVMSHRLNVCIGHGWKNWQPTDLQNSKNDVGDLTETKFGEAEAVREAGFREGATRDLSRLVTAENLVNWQQSDMYFRWDLRPIIEIDILLGYIAE